MSATTGQTFDAFAIGSGVMMGGSLGILGHKLNQIPGGSRFNFSLVETHGIERTFGFNSSLQRDGIGFNVIEVGTARDGNAVNNTIPVDFMRAAYSMCVTTHRDPIINAAVNPNTTVWHTNQGEAGFNDETGRTIREWPQPSLTAQLVTLLFQRWFNNNTPPAITVVCWELILENGWLMKKKVVAMARRMGLPREFISWLKTPEVWFPCNVQNLICVKRLRKPHPGTEGGRPFVGVEPPGMFAFTLEQHPYNSLMNPFPPGLPGLEYVDRKRARAIYLTKCLILNALHVALVAKWIAEGLGFETVLDAMSGNGIEQWLRDLGAEIIALHGDDLVDPQAFLEDVIRRFKNDNIAHMLADIAAGIEGKWIVRVQPSRDKANGNSPLLVAVCDQHAANVRDGKYARFQYKK